MTKIIHGECMQVGNTKLICEAVAGSNIYQPLRHSRCRQAVQPTPAALINKLVLPLSGSGSGDYLKIAGWIIETSCSLKDYLSSIFYEVLPFTKMYR